MLIKPSNIIAIIWALFVGFFCIGSITYAYDNLKISGTGSSTNGSSTSTPSLAQVTAVGASTAVLSTFSGGLSLGAGSMSVVTGDAPDDTVITPQTAASSFITLKSIAGKNYDVLGNAALAGLIDAPSIFFSSGRQSTNEWTLLSMSTSGSRDFTILGQNGDGYDGYTSADAGVGIKLQTGAGGTNGGDGGDINLSTDKANANTFNGGDLILNFGAGKTSGRKGWMTMKNTNDALRYAMNGTSGYFEIYANGSTSSAMQLYHNGTNAVIGTTFGSVSIPSLTLSVPLAIGDIASTAVSEKGGYSAQPNFDFSESIIDFGASNNWTNIWGYFDINSNAHKIAGSLAAADFEAVVTSTNSYNYHNVVGGIFGAQHNGTGIIDTLYGNNIYAWNNGLGSVKQIQGLYMDAANYGTGNVGNLLGGYFQTGSYGTGTTTYDASIYIPSPYTNGNNLGKHYGIVLEDQRGATTSESYAFKYPESVTAGVSPFVVAASGTVGIGTLAPTRTLSVTGDTTLQGAQYIFVQRGQDVNLLPGTYYYAVSSTGAAVDVVLPVESTNGRQIIIKDEKCTAATYNIRVDGAGTDTIDTTSTVYTMSTNCEAARFTYLGGNWMVD